VLHTYPDQHSSNTRAAQQPSPTSTAAAAAANASAAAGWHALSAMAMVSGLAEQAPCHVAAEHGADVAPLLNGGSASRQHSSAIVPNSSLPWSAADAALEPAINSCVLSHAGHEQAAGLVAAQQPLSSGKTRTLGSRATSHSHVSSMLIFGLLHSEINPSRQACVTQP